MHVDRYVKIVLTVIALELFWIGVKDTAPAVAAQAVPAATPVVIRGIELDGADPGSIPVVASRPLRVDDARPIAIKVDGSVLVEAVRALPVESVPYRPSQSPGE